MDDPVAEIPDVVYKLTTGNRAIQQLTLEQYFTPNASFKHPFCSTGPDRSQVLGIFQWYKIMSPHIDIEVNSVAYDETQQLLYVNITQIFKLWPIPFYRAPVTLTTLLELVRGQDLNTTNPSNNKKAAKYFIASQNDLYQVDQFVRFVLPWGLGTAIVGFWHWVAMMFCVWAAFLLSPFQPAIASMGEAVGGVEEEVRGVGRKVVGVDGGRGSWVDARKER